MGSVKLCKVVIGVLDYNLNLKISSHQDKIFSLETGKICIAPNSETRVNSGRIWSMIHTISPLWQLICGTVCCPGERAHFLCQSLLLFLQCLFQTVQQRRKTALKVLAQNLGSQGRFIFFRSPVSLKGQKGNRWKTTERMAIAPVSKSNRMSQWGPHL